MSTRSLTQSILYLATITFFLSTSVLNLLGTDARSAVAYGAHLAPLEEAPPRTPLVSENPTHAYRHYPDAQIYFNPSRGMCFFRDGNEWIGSDVLPRGFRERLGEYGIVEMGTAKPYRSLPEVVQYNPIPSRASEEITKPTAETAPVPAPNVPYRYYYYPKSQVFFDPDHHIYFYSLNHRWHKSSRLPNRLGPIGKDYVIIETDTDTPYTYHSQVLYMLSKEQKSASPTSLLDPPWEPKGNDPVYHYLYYPGTFVYLDGDRGLYYYYSNDRWQESSSLPSYLAGHLGNSVALIMNSPRPYQYHADVLDRYPSPAAKATESRQTFQIWTRPR